MTLAPGATLQQRYIIRTTLVQDDVRIKYLADHTYLEQLICLESLSDQMQHSPKFDALCHEFLSSARQLAPCRHPHLASIVDAFSEDGLPYVGFEYPQGLSLQDLLQLGKPLSQASALSYVHQVGEALRVLHSNGLAHGHVSPETIIRCHAKDGVMLTGARLPLFRLSEHATDDDRATDPKSASSEQLATDVRSLAAVLWTTLTAQRATPDLVDRDVLSYRLRQINITLAPDLEAAIADGLATQGSIDDWLAMLPVQLSEPDPSSQGAIASPAQALANDVLPSSVQPHMQTSNLDSSSTTSSEQTTRVSASDPDVAMLEPADRFNSTHRAQEPITVLQSATALQMGAAAPRPMPPQKRSRRFPVILAMTALAAGFAGAGAGAALRLNLNSATSSPSQSSALFNRAQSFPPSDQWPGQSLAEIDSTDGYLFEQPNTGWAAPPRVDYYPSTPQPTAPIYADPYPATTPWDEPTPNFDAELDPLDETVPSASEPLPGDRMPMPDINTAPDLANPVSPSTTTSGAPSESVPSAPAPPTPIVVPEALLPSPSPSPTKQTPADIPDVSSP